MAESCVPSTSSKCVTVSNDVTNFHRLAEIIRIAQIHLRTRFQDLYFKKFNTPWCSENGASLLESLTSVHFLPGVNSKIRAGDLNEWDFTTLSFVILKLSEKEGEREAVIQLREIRNTMSHLGGDWGVKNEDYERHVRDLKIHLAAIGLQDDEITGIMEHAINLHFGDAKSLTEEQKRAYLDAIGYYEPDEDEFFSLRSAAGNFRFNKSKLVYNDKSAETKGSAEGFYLWLDYLENFVAAMEKKQSPGTESSSKTDTEPEEKKVDTEWTSFQELPRTGKEMLQNVRKMMEEMKEDQENAPKRAMLNLARGFLSEVERNLSENSARKSEQPEEKVQECNDTENLPTRNTSENNDLCIDELD